MRVVLLRRRVTSTAEVPAPDALTTFAWKVLYSTNSLETLEPRTEMAPPSKY
eukprot:COSAG06_NODE_57780_length_279_cov_0.616667_1_plen_51_part_10